METPKSLQTPLAAFLHDIIGLAESRDIRVSDFGLQNRTLAGSMEEGTIILKAAWFEEKPTPQS